MDDAAQGPGGLTVPYGARAVLARTPVVDDARVAGIRAALATGTYCIDPQRIAERLLKAEALAQTSERKPG